MKMYVKLKTCFLLTVLVIIKCQEKDPIPLSPGSFRQILRSFISVPEGRRLSLSDTRIIYYTGSIRDQTWYEFSNITSLLKHPNFDSNKPTVLYIYGYVELATDYSVLHVVQAYIKRGGYNILVLDWANRGFGNYLSVVLDVELVGEETGKALVRLVKNGLNIKSLHLVGHSAGVQIAAVTARVLKKSGYIVPRVTGLDPAYPGFYPPLDAAPISAEDADFVDIIHTDGGKFGVPYSSGHADFYPNGGKAPQPGCPPVSIPLSSENFCSHWRSWRFWAESVTGGNFVARRSTDFDSFLKGKSSGIALMGPSASPDLRGNFYLRTALKEPFALGDRGAV